MVWNIVIVSVNLCCAPALIFMYSSLNCVRGKAVVNQSTHVVLNVLVPERETAECSDHWPTIN